MSARFNKAAMAILEDARATLAAKNAIVMDFMNLVEGPNGEDSDKELTLEDRLYNGLGKPGKDCRVCLLGALTLSEGHLRKQHDGNSLTAAEYRNVAVARDALDHVIYDTEIGPKNYTDPRDRLTALTQIDAAMEVLRSGKD